MKKPARPKKPVRKTPAAPKHVVHPPHVRAHPHQQQHHGRPNPKMKATPISAGAPKHPKAKHHKRRQLALTEGVACCAAEGLAATLRLAGHPVTDADVLELYRLTASDPDAGASILATLLAAQDFGLAGCRPESWRDLLSGSGEAGHAVDRLLECAAGDCQPAHDPAPGGLVHAASVVVGVTLPGGPHALTLDPSGLVWSWGELYDPAELAPGPAEEAWLVTWELSA